MTWIRILTLAAVVAVILALTLGYAYIGQPGVQQPAKLTEPAPPALATVDELSGVASRVNALERKGKALATAEAVAALQADVERLKKAVSALAGGDRSKAKGLVTGSVK